MAEFNVKESRCRSCGRPIIWATVLATGRRMPVNPLPSPYGTLVLFLRRQEGRVPEVYARTVSVSAPLRPGEQRRVSHFADCPEAELHRQEHEERQSIRRQLGQRRFGKMRRP